jgi:BirA family biotin operon repressor/biotin-[acetyl-CoA-carboxylase] ligase
MHEIHLSVVDSTNLYAKNHCRAFPQNEITCVVAEEQTAGVGRYKRKWVSPKGVGLYVTFYLALPLQTMHLISLAQLMSLSFAKVLIKEGLQPEIKWPNDVRLSGKKVSGVLCETQFHPEHVDLFLGIGVNVNLDAETAANIDQPATSLLIETGKKWDKVALLKKLEAQFVEDLTRFKKEGFTPFYKQFDELLAFKGEEVRCFDGKKTWVGICHSLTPDGQLNLLLPDHTLHQVLSGDIC